MGSTSSSGDRGKKKSSRPPGGSNPRREGREAAVKFLFAADLNAVSKGTEQQTVDAFWALNPTEKRARRFATPLMLGVMAHLKDLDAIIRRHVLNYELERLSTVDRNVLRLALYEMHHCMEIPPVVSINEAIEIARRFGTEASAEFVNGVLDQAKNELDRPLRTAFKSERSSETGPCDDPSPS